MSRAARTILAGAVLLSASCSASQTVLDPALEHAQWVVARDFAITVFEGSTPRRALTSGHRDWKPVWSATGDRVVFFRALHEDGLTFQNWRTMICVVNADGTGFRELTSGAYADFNPTWTRDGTNRILFNRELPTGPNGFHLEMYATSPDAAPGDEVLVPGNGHEYQWVNSGLRDGRLLVDGVQWQSETSSFDIGVWLLTADGEGGWSWAGVTRPFADQIWHKVTVSPGETRVAFMLDRSNGNVGDYRDDVLYWARFDPVARTVTDPVAITDPTGGRCTNEYPRWSPDEQFIIYDSDCAGRPVVHAYRLADGETSVLARDPGRDLRIASFARIPQ
jgi:hypothetical protein